MEAAGGTPDFAYSFISKVAHQFHFLAPSVLPIFYHSELTLRERKLLYIEKKGTPFRKSHFLWR